MLESIPHRILSMDSATANAITAWATTVNAVCIIALAVITWWYAKSTAQLLDETKKARGAAERQAKAAEENIRVLRQQLEEQAGLGRIIVEGKITSLMRSIDYWKSFDLGGVSAFIAGIPEASDLVPPDAQSLVEHAMRVSQEAASYLQTALDNLGFAKKELERIEDSKAVLTSPTKNYEPPERRFHAFLKEASISLTNAQKQLHKIDLQKSESIK